MILDTCEVREKNGILRWKKVEVNLKHHVIVPILPKGMSPEFYDEYLYDYLSKLGMDPLPENRKFIYLRALVSCLKRLDNPSIPLSFPSLHSSNSSKRGDYNMITSILERVPQVSSWIANTVLDFGASLLKSSVIKDVESPIRSVHDGVEFQPMAFTTIEFSMDDMKIIKNRLKVTINDVITGIILLGSRLYMEGEIVNSSRSNSNALVLINTRNLGGYKSTAAKYIHNTMRNSSITISNLIGPVEKTSMDNLPIKGLYFFVTGSPQSLTSHGHGVQATVAVRLSVIENE
ncbi:hypothetical protein POM88_012382 [Heracleum sosnowskyi]|uniref:O-acyltransferase WSD1 C-terminal domain-containing protein n=1 Tax=Heracleum sosnowskyi TaxID=360622 RepID=A0AAD8IYW8_9APIA|nr:hypothetical protein POM88_012382 [Heracleum sosnowskyi]